MPVVVIGSLVLAVGFAPDGVEDFYTDYAFPFLVSVWIGMGFIFAWDAVAHPLHADDAPPLLVGAVGVLGALVILSMLGGIRVLWEDPWIFGVAVAPGLRLALPLLSRGHRGSARQQ
jgi:hypothetical protein